MMRACLEFPVRYVDKGSDSGVEVSDMHIKFCMLCLMRDRMTGYIKVGTKSQYSCKPGKPKGEVQRTAT